MKEQVQKLESLLEKLSTSDRAFAQDLIDNFKKYKKLSASQAIWVGKLIDRALNPPKHVTISVGAFSGVVALFNVAKEHLKYPKITLSCEGKKVMMSVAGPTSKHPGWINVMGEGQYPNREWFGTVNPNGEWSPSLWLQKNPSFMESMQNLLQEFAIDPAAVAMKHGHLTGNCCFCNSPLTDPKSTAAGFGPVCSEHYGLKEQWKTAVNHVSNNKEGDVVKLSKQVDEVLEEAFEKDELSPWEEPVVKKDVGSSTLLAGTCYLCEKNLATILRDGWNICADCDAQMSASKAG